MNTYRAPWGFTTNVYLVFDEVEISPASYLYNIYSMPCKRLRHADGSDNATFPTFPSAQMWADPDTNSSPIYFPAMNHTAAGAAVDQDALVQNVKKYFEIFDVNIQVASALPLQKTAFHHYVKILPPKSTLTGSADFQNFGPRYYPFKRGVWWDQKGSGALFGCAFPSDNYAIIGNDSDGDPIKNFVPSIVHEIGHLFGLGHQGDFRHPVKQRLSGLSYYGATHPDWSPIMGYTYDRPIFQWSNTDYVHGVLSQYGGGKGYQNDLLKMISWGLKLKKEPIATHQPTPSGPIGNLSRRPPSKKKPVTKDMVHARYMTEEDGLEIIGMLGYDRDYDIIKVLLPFGSALITVEPYLEGKEVVNMVDPRLEILYCNADLEFDRSTKSYFDFNEPWKPNLPSNWTDKNIFHGVQIENDEDKHVYQVGTSYVGTSGPKSSLTTYTSYTTLVYIKVSQNWNGNVDDITKKPLTADQGYSPYGSLGKYKLKFSKPQKIATPSYSLPIGRFEKFKVCREGYFEETWLLVQDENDNSPGDPSKEGMHVIELPIFKNGTKENKKFIVYGKPLSPSDEKKNGRYYLTISKDGELCKRQEFIVGIGKDEESSGQGLNLNP